VTRLSGISKIEICSTTKALAVKLPLDWDAIVRLLEHPELPLTNGANWYFFYQSNAAQPVYQVHSRACCFHHDPAGVASAGWRLGMLPRQSL
jgi:hypothetical protein